MKFKAKQVRFETAFDVYVVECVETGEKRYYKLYEEGKIEDARFPRAIVGDAIKKLIRGAKS